MFLNKTNIMRFSQASRVVGLLMMIISGSMLTPLLTHFWYHDGSTAPFVFTFLATLLFGFLLWFPFRHLSAEIKTRDGFLIAALFWVFFCLFSSLPFLFALPFHLPFTDAFFETMSGVTATGVNTFFHLDKMPHDIIFYRQQLQFLGGISIIILAVAIMPMLGIGGMQLFRTESSSPIKDNKLTPRVVDTAKRIWMIYVGLTILCAFFYWLFGMTPFDAIGESFATLATGGFSTHDASFAFYHSKTLELIAMIFMLLSATNFSLHVLAIRHKSIKEYFQDSEFKLYILILLIAALITIVTLTLHHTQHSLGTNIMNGLFTITSIITTTGYTCTNFAVWPVFLPIFIMLLGLMGGCSGSTAGGLKMARSAIFFKQIRREFKRLMHPNAIVPITFDQQELSNDILKSVWGFAALYIITLLVLICALMATGLDFTSAYGAVAACLSNSGAAIGSVAKNFSGIPVLSKWLLSFTMLIGRLEIFTVFILFAPGYWRR